MLRFSKKCSCLIPTQVFNFLAEGKLQGQKLEWSKIITSEDNSYIKKKKRKISTEPLSQLSYQVFVMSINLSNSALQKYIHIYLVLHYILRVSIIWKH